MSWVYRCFIEGLCGLRGVREGLKVDPKMPNSWDGMRVTRLFRKATFEMDIKRTDIKSVQVVLDGKRLDGLLITNIEAGRTYKVQVSVPRSSKVAMRPRN